MENLILNTDFKYVLLSALAVVEGPFVSLASGFFIRLGYLQFLPTILILIAGDIASDTIYYVLAVKSRSKQYVKSYSRKHEGFRKNLNYLNRLWGKHGRVTMFLGKMAYGFTVPLIFSSAISGVSYRKMLEYTIPPSALKYIFLIIVGYYMAYSYRAAERYIFLSTIYVPLLFLLFFLSYRFITRYLKKKAGDGKK